jgi:large subunit ribosomal protein L23
MSAAKTAKTEKTAKTAKTEKGAKTVKADKAATTMPAAGPKFDQGRLLTVLLAPTVSEKATQIADKHSQVTFEVAADATKPEVKAAVELLFKVQVDSVQMVNVRGKAKRFGAYSGRRRNWKKAYVCLKPGQEINFAQEV